MSPRRSPTLRPTRLGLAFLGLTILTLIGCINYGLSLGYGLTFLLGGVWIVTAAQAGRAARTLHLTWQSPPQAVAGQPLTFLANTLQDGPAGKVLIRAQALQNGVAWPVNVLGEAAGGSMTPLHLPVAGTVRGPLKLGQVQLVAIDTFGLWHAYYPAPDSPEILVAPAPEPDAPAPPSQLGVGEGDTGRRMPGHEEFAGVRAYAAGDSPRLISWKHAARTGTLMTREFDAPAAQALSLNWDATLSAGHTEKRLSRLAAWIAFARDHGLSFSFAIPGTTLKAAAGEAQARAALAALAAFSPLPAPQIQTKEKEDNRPASLDISALRLTLLALGFALLPGVLRYPIWVTALIAGLLGYRALQADPQRKWPEISSVVLVLLAGAAALGLNTQYGTLLGQDAGTAILAVLLALKAAETRNVRDAKLLSLLGVFMTSTHYFHGQGPLTALHSLLSALVLLSALAQWVIPRAKVAPAAAATRAAATGAREDVRAAGRVLLLSAPIALLLFAFFPRPDGPLWRLPLQGGNQTGLSDEITAGEFGNLAQSRAVAFRADFAGGPIPPPEERYWRGPVYEAYDGLKWTQLRRGFANPSIEAISGSPIYRYALTLEPNGKPWLLALDTPLALPPKAFLTAGFQAVTTPISLRTRFEMQSQAARLGVSESVNRLEADLKLPEGQSPRARALAQSWRTLAPDQRVNAALKYFAQGGYKYTLDAPTLSEQNRIDDFLFRSKLGFCEHYSSAFAFLMRAAGVPTRIVGGYQGGELNPVGGYLIVRQQDAHAWNEVWLQGQGWVRVDPTAVIAPARIRANLGTALEQPNAQVAAAQTQLDALRLRLDSFQNAWNNWVVSYNGDQQRNLLSRLGISGVGSAPYMLGLALVVGLLLLPILALVRRAARPRDPALATLHDLSEKLALPRDPGETATAYTRRAEEQYPALSGPLREIAALFNELRYAEGGSKKDQLRALQVKIRALRRK